MSRTCIGLLHALRIVAFNSYASGTAFNTREHCETREYGVHGYS